MRILACFVLLAVAAGCGQKGPLYLRENPPPEVLQPPAPPVQPPPALPEQTNPPA